MGILYFFYVNRNKNKEGFEWEENYRKTHSADFYNKEEADRKNAEVTIEIGLIMGFTPLGLGIFAIGPLLDEYVSEGDPKNRDSLYGHIYALEKQRDYDKAQIPIVDFSTNLLNHTVKGNITQIKNYSRSIINDINEIMTDIQTLYSLNNIVDSSSNIGIIYYNFQDIKVYLNILLNNNTLSNLKTNTDIKTSQKMVEYLDFITTNFYPQLNIIINNINNYIPESVGKNTPDTIQTFLTKLKQINTNMKKISNSISLLKQTDYKTLYGLHAKLEQEIKDLQKEDDDVLQPYKRRKNW